MKHLALLIILCLVPFKVEGQSSKQRLIDSLAESVRQTNDSVRRELSGLYQLLDVVENRRWLKAALDSANDQLNGLLPSSPQLDTVKGGYATGVIYSLPKPTLKASTKYKVIWHEFVPLVKCRWEFQWLQWEADRRWGDSSKSRPDSAWSCDTLGFRPTIISYEEVEE